MTIFVFNGSGSSYLENARCPCCGEPLARLGRFEHGLVPSCGEVEKAEYIIRGAEKGHYPIVEMFPDGYEAYDVYCPNCHRRGCQCTYAERKVRL